MKIEKKYFINFYTIFGVLALVWMLFLDSHDFLSVMEKRARNRKNKRQITYYKEKIAVDRENYNSFKDNAKATERFGRENYLMKKPDEDVYLIISE